MKRIIILLFLLNTFVGLTQAQIKFEFKSGEKESSLVPLSYDDSYGHSHPRFFGSWKGYIYLFTLTSGNAPTNIIIEKIDKSTFKRVDKIFNSFSTFYKGRHFEKALMIKDKIYFIYSRYNKKIGLKSFYYQTYSAETMEEIVEQTFIDKISRDKAWDTKISFEKSKNNKYKLQTIYKIRDTYYADDALKLFNVKLYDENFEMVFSKDLEFSNFEEVHKLQTFVTNDGVGYIFLYSEKEIIFYQIIEGEEIKKIVIPVYTFLIKSFTFSVTEDFNLMCYFKYSGDKLLLLLDFFNEKVKLSSEYFTTLNQLTEDKYKNEYDAIVSYNTQFNIIKDKRIDFGNSFIYNNNFYVFTLELSPVSMLKNEKSKTKDFSYAMKNIILKYDIKGNEIGKITLNEFNNTVHRPIGAKYPTIFKPTISYMIIDSDCYFLLFDELLHNLKLYRLDLLTDEIESSVIKQYNNKKKEFTYINTLTYPNEKDKTFYITEKPGPVEYSKPYIISTIKILE